MKRTALLLAVLAFGCGDSSTDVAATAHVGTYTLRTIDNAPLPVTILVEGTASLVITAGSVNLNSDATFTDRTDYQIVSGTTTISDSDVAAGTYTRNGSTIELRTSDGGVYSMAFSNGNTLTQTFEGSVLVYRK
ncbi:MAG TPA: hypothetical protein VMN60_04815 [Longimicrobiales bacterium]|nr:hypothetical protein [Longimicrobiales bacterium]